MKYIKNIGIVCFLLLLAACGAPNSPKPIQTVWTEADLSAHISDMALNIQSLIGKSSPGLDLLAAIPQNSPVANFSLLQNLGSLQNPQENLQELGQLSFFNSTKQNLFITGIESLPRGYWKLDPDTGLWEKTGDASDLILDFPIENPDGTNSSAKVVFDWDAKAPTRQVASPGGEIEVPSDMTIALSSDGNSLGLVSIAAEWYASTCGYATFEPVKLAIKGEFKGFANESLSFVIDVQGSDTDKGQRRVQIDSLVTLKVGDDSAEFAFDTNLYGKVLRDEDCFFTDYQIQKGDVAAKLSVTVNAQKDSLGISFAFTKPSIDISTGYYSATIKNGKVTANDQVVVTFAGVLDDGNENGIPGENILIEFDDGSSLSLEDVLAGL